MTATENLARLGLALPAPPEPIGNYVPWRLGGGLLYSEPILNEDGPTVYQHACRLGLEGIVSKRIDSPYRSGRVRTWLKTKNPKRIS